MRKYIFCILALLPIASLLASFPASSAMAAFAKPFPAVLREPDPALIPTVNLETIPLPNIDEGYAMGVTGTFTGNIGDYLIVAGGSNMSNNMISFDSELNFYDGIYAIRPDNPADSWKKIGTLPQGAAYGVCIKYENSLILAGGSSATGDLAQVIRVTLTNGELVSEALPPLPGSMSHMGGCSIGNSIYVVGGMFNGTFSNIAFKLDMENTSLGWQIAGYIPGSARVDPVCAASNGSLYIWGGYSQARPTNPYILSIDGYKYEPTTGAWPPAATPKRVHLYYSAKI